MTLDRSYIGYLGFLGIDLFKSLLMYSNGAICLIKLLFDLGLFTVQLLYNSSWKFHQLAAGQLLSGQPVRYRKASQDGPFIMYKITPAGSLSSSQGHRVGPAL
jgi:hypothetical protein